MSKRTNNDIYFKREDLQPVFSFKLRGAYNCMANLSTDAQKAGVVACSAGNHAQGVALSATKLGLDATIVMPTGTPRIKVDSVISHGANVVLHGNTYDDAQEEAMRLVREEGRTLIHPFDDPYVIAGQGTIGMEILRERTGKPLDVVFVCCGGGGMLAGIASYIKSVRPSVKVIGVEAEDAAGMTESLRSGEVTPLDSVGLFADGASVRVVGKWKSICRVFIKLAKVSRRKGREFILNMSEKKEKQSKIDTVIFFTLTVVFCPSFF
jgi:threonine dehydratase